MKFKFIIKIKCRIKVLVLIFHKIVMAIYSKLKSKIIKQLKFYNKRFVFSLSSVDCFLLFLVNDILVVVIL